MRNRKTISSDHRGPERVLRLPVSFHYNPLEDRYDDDSNADWIPEEYEKNGKDKANRENTGADSGGVGRQKS